MAIAGGPFWRRVATQPSPKGCGRRPRWSVISLTSRAVRPSSLCASAPVMSVPVVTVSKPVPATDDPLDLGAVRAGDGAARACLYRRFAGVVHGIVLSVAGPADADDLTQDVFVKVFERIGELRDDAACAGWICGVARNAALDRRRRRRHAAQPLVAEPAAPRTADDELATRVLAHVRSLPDAYRETLVLRLVEGLSGVEIAARTGLTHGSVRVNLHRGMSLLRPLLEAEGWR